MTYHISRISGGLRYDTQTATEICTLMSSEYSPISEAEARAFAEEHAATETIASFFAFEEA